MDRRTLEQYRKLKKEIVALDKSIEDLRKKMDNVQTVIGTVQSSMKDFPYTRTHVSVEMAEPKEASVLKMRIEIRERRRGIVNNLITEIEEYILSIPDSADRQIFEMIYVDGLSFQEAADQLGYDRSTIGKRITKQLSPNSPF